MIVYGIQSSLRKTEVIAENCPNCNTSGSLQMNVFQRYVHIFWIPVVPIGKTGVSQCLHCRQILKLKEMPALVRLGYDNLKTHTGVPIWTFAGLAIIALLIAGEIISDKQKAVKVRQMITALKKDDVLEVKLKSDVYTLFKVDHVSGNMIYLAMNKFQTNVESSIDDLKSKEYDTSIIQEFPVSQLIDNSKIEIIDIDRK
jgi:cell division protein FtsL